MSAVQLARAGLVTGRVIRVGPYSLRVSPRVLGVSALLALLAVAVGVLTMLHGTMELTPGEVVRALLGDGEDSVLRTVRNRRLPRLLTAMGVGGSLGAAGAVFQSLSRNPLGSPDIIGFTSGAATGAVVQIVLFDGGVLATALAAVVGGVVTALLVYGLARKDGVSGGLRLILVGIGIGALAAAITSFLMVRADLDTATEAQIWTAGSLTARGWPHALSVLGAVAVLLPLLLIAARRLSLMEMGDDAAAALGVPVERYRFLVMVLAVGLTAVAVAATGPIAFIALAAPQIVRRLVGRGGVLIMPSFLMGATLLVLADILSQTIDVGLRTPIGTVTSLLGGAYLIALLARRA